MYRTANYAYANGEIFYCCSDGVGDFTGGYSVQEAYYEVEGNQVAVVELDGANGYEGNVLKFRFDAYDGGVDDPDEAELTVYKAGFFKELDDALLFRAEGVEVELDPDYLAEVSDEPADSTDKSIDPDTTENTPVTEPDGTEADNNGTDAGTDKAPTTSDEGKKTEKKNNTWIIYTAAGVAAAAAAAIAVVLIAKKKKK